MSPQFTLSWEVGLEGFFLNFFKGDKEVELESIEKENVSPGERLPVQVINQLVDDELAEIQGTHIIIPHETAASLPVDERIALGFPEPFPFEIEIKSSGNLSSSNFRYIYRFLDGSYQPFVNPKRIGSYLEITPEQKYLLSTEQYNLVEAIESFNNRKVTTKSSEMIKNNLLVFAKIKGLAGSTGAILDTYLNNEQVIAPSKLSVRLKKIDEDTIEVEPVLCYGDEEEGSLQNALDEVQNEKFIKTFDQMPRVKESYAIPRGPKIVFSEKQKKALEPLKNNRKFSGKAKESFLKTPQVHLDTEVFVLDNFADRVIEIGEYKPRVFPFIKPSKEPWIPPEGGIVVDGAMVYVSPEEMQEFKERVEDAYNAGEKEINWKGDKVPATEEAINAISDLIETRDSEETAQEESLSGYQDGCQKENKNKHVLIIKDNFDEIDYKYEKQFRPGIPRLPGSLKDGVELLPHQKEGINWLQNRWIGGAGGALVADDMGLGKTLQALSFVAWVRELMDTKEYNEKPILVVAPVALLKNWREEYERFLEPVFGPVLELHGSELKNLKDQSVAKELSIKKEIEVKEKNDAEEIISRGRGVLLRHSEIEKRGIVLTTYETVRDYQFSLGLINWAVMILDESQKIKTPSAMVTTAVKAMKYDFGVCLTGTPVENSWVDLWSTIDFIQPGWLGSLKEFNSKFQNPLNKPGTDRLELGKNLKSKIEPLLRRRMKEDYLEGLPKKYLYAYEVQMPQEQINQYVQIVQKAQETLPDRLSGKRKQHIFNVIASLRDISLHPYLPYYSEEGLAELSDEQIISASARLKKTIEILDDIKSKKEKAVIYVISRKMQRVLQRIIENRYKIDCQRPINGEVTGGRRKQLIDTFQIRSGFNVIIMSPEAAGVGLNVTSANHVIHLSRAWNPAKEDQATDRVYRIGQNRTVYIHIPLAVHSMFDSGEEKGTFDLKLHKLLDEKRQLSRNVLLPPVVNESEWDSFTEDTIQVTTEEEVQRSVLSIEDLDSMAPDYFEKVVASLYEKMGYDIELTPQTRDYGADVIAKSRDKEKPSFLIQCKHASNPSKAKEHSGVMEVLSAGGVYSKEYGTKFPFVVITNAKSFTEHARQIASDNNVHLYARDKLINLLEKFKVSIRDIL